MKTTIAALFMALLLLALPGCGGNDSSGRAAAVSRHIAATDSLRGIKSLYKRYAVASENAAFFAKEDMQRELGRNLMCLGDVMTQLDDTLRAAEYYSRAEACFRSVGSGRDLFEVALHRTNTIPRAENAEIFRSLLADPILRTDTALLVRTLKGAYMSTDSLPLLDSCLSLLAQSPPDMLSTERPVLLAMRAEESLNSGDIEGAMSLLPAIRTSGEPVAVNREYIHSIMAFTYYSAGMLDSCINELLQTVWWTDSAYREANLPAIYSAETRRLIEMTEANSRLERRNISLVWAMAALVLLAAALWIYFRAKGRQAAARHEIALLDSRLESLSQAHTAQAAVMEEHRRLVADLRQAVQGSASPLAAEVTKILSVYGSNDDTRQGLLAVSREVNPRFTTRLKADFPTLSEGQLRLAALIAAGVDSHQLSAILNISGKSVYTGRYRLRTQLGLSKTDSLEDFLRRYNTP